MNNKRIPDQSSANASNRRSGLTNLVCIYCQRKPSTPTGDHVPPKCFFPPSSGYELLKVPCCLECNNKFSAIDEKVWTAWTSLEEVEKHPVVRDIIQPKIRREWEKKIGKQRQYAKSIVLPNRPLTPEEYLTAPDIQLRIEPETVKFLARMTSAITYCDQGFSAIYDTGFDWQELSRKNPDEYDNLFFKYLLPTREPVSIGGDIFRNCAYVFPQFRKVHCWMKSYDSLEFGTTLTLPERMIKKIGDTYLIFPD